MKIPANLPLVLVGLVCLTALALSVYPGWLMHFVFVSALFGEIVAIPAAIVSFVALAFWFSGDFPAVLRKAAFWGRLATAGAMLLVTLALISFYVPRRIVFAACRSGFEKQVAALEGQPEGVVPLNRAVGPFFVDECGVDERGGIYFRTHTHPDGIGPDTMSYGFCFRPDWRGSPFGAADYRLFRLSPDWYWFKASDGRDRSD